MQNNIKIKETIVVLVISMIAALSSCVSDQIAPKAVEVPDEVFFATDIIPIFDASCNTNGCHNGTIPPDLTPANAYTSLAFFGYLDTLSEDNSKLWNKISGGSMEEYASDQDRALILQWMVEQDAPNN